MTDAELEQRIRTLFAPGPVPEAAERQVEIVLTRRAAGERVLLPLDPETRRVSLGRIGLALSGIAASILLLIRLAAPSRDTTAASAFEVATLYAQATDRPTFPVIRAVRPLHPGVWRYGLVNPSGEADPADAWQQGLSRGRYEGVDAWVWRYGRNGRVTDTLWLATESLRPLAREAATRIGTHVTQIFKETGVLNGIHYPSGMIEWRSVPFDSLGPRLIGGGRDSADFYDSPGQVAMWRPQIAATLGAADLGPGWRGSMEAISATIGFMAIHFWLNFEVVGEETVTVPAGSFDTWRVQMGRRPGWYAWVSKNRGWLIQLGTTDARRSDLQVLLDGRESD